MHFKSLPLCVIHGQTFGRMIFARALALLPLPIGCLALR